MKSQAWKRFEQTLKQYNLSYRRSLKVSDSILNRRVTIEFWIPAARSWGKCTHVFFTATHPSERYSKGHRKSFSVFACVDGMRKSLRDAYWNLRFESGKF